jgi:SAM-dependent methyltransferase
VLRHGVDLAEIKPGMRVALVGSGFMGSIILQLLAVSPVSNISVFDLRPESLEYARGFSGKAPVDVYDLKNADTAALHGSFDVVYETAAVEPAFRLANSLVRTGGTLAIFSWQHHPFEFDFGDWHVRGIRVLNHLTRCAPDFTACFHRSAALMERGVVDVGASRHPRGAAGRRSGALRRRTLQGERLHKGSDHMELNFKQGLTAVFGHPVAENPTQVMVEAAYRHHEIFERYLTIEVLPQDLGAAVSGARAMGFDGFNLTIPHKVAVIQHLDGLGESARVIGAVQLRRPTGRPACR